MIIEKNVYLQLHAVPVKAYNFFLSFEVSVKIHSTKIITRSLCYMYANITKYFISIHS